MTDACHSISARGAAAKSTNRISGLYMGAIIILSCAVSVVPIELFLIEIWPRHGFSSLLLFVGPLVAGGIIARILPERYYRIRSFESGGRIYERLGVRFFKRFVPNGDYVNRRIRQAHPNYRVIFDQESMVRFEVGTHLAEALHIGGLILAVPCSAYALLLGWNKFALWLLLANIAVHFYPVLLQRYTRSRIQTVLNRRNHTGTR